MAMKLFAQPQAEQAAKLERFTHEALWGTLQHPNYSVVQSTFWYDPTRPYLYDPDLNWVPQTATHYSNSWNGATANVTSRSYGYIYPAAAYWSLYRVGRAFPEMIQLASWQWYLNQSYHTVKYCFEETNGTHLQPLWNAGLMGETVIGELLKDLRREGWVSEASEVESLMEARANAWDVMTDPFGSEQPWDCTGQEGVFYWSK
jgi:hypothetical protein